MENERLNMRFCFTGLSLALIAAFSAAASDVSITRSDSEDKQRGGGLWRKRVTALVDSAVITYEGVHKEGSAALIQEKYGDRRFGLAWPREKGWNWSLESFLDVMVSCGGKTYDGTGLRVLEDCRTLEEGGRAMAEYVWLLAEPPAGGAGDVPRLTIRMLHDPAWKEWLFARISAEGGDASLAQIKLCCYPSCSSGPPERERWILVPGGDLKMGGQPQVIPIDGGGIAYYNKYQQTRDGCFLVFQPKDVADVKVAGTYGVGTSITLKPGTGSAALALGYFIDTPAENAGRMFIAETLSQVAAQLGRIEWTPNLPLAEFDAAIARTGRMLESSSPWPECVIHADEATAAARKAAAGRFTEIRKAYDKAKAEKSLDGLLAAVRDAAALRKQTAEGALKLIE